jgi:hypothetical protein
MVFQKRQTIGDRDPAHNDAQWRLAWPSHIELIR